MKPILTLILAFFTLNTSAHKDYANDTCRKIDHYLTSLNHEKGFSGALLIIKDGKPIFSTAYGYANREKQIPFTPSTPSSMGSITKAFTATAIIKLVEKGKIKTEDPLSKFFPDAPSDKANITIHQLLTHSAGFHEFTQQDDGDYEKVDTKEFVRRAFTEPLSFPPGTKSEYTNVGYSILGIIIEKVSGTDYETFLKNELFTPAGMKSTGYGLPLPKSDSTAHGYKDGTDWGSIPQHIAAKGTQPYWNLKANGGLQISLEDMQLWINAIEKNKIISAESKKKLFTPYVKEEGFDSYFGYGCNIGKSRRNTEVIDNGGSNGIYFARLIRYPEEKVTFYLATNVSEMNANMVLPNITQLYFNGEIKDDATLINNDLSKKDLIYDMLVKQKVTDLATELKKKNIEIHDDMILLEVGHRLTEEKKMDEALTLYKFYTTEFPNIVVAWNELGDIYREQNKTKEAIACYEKVLQIRPENERAKNNLQMLNKTR